MTTPSNTILQGLLKYIQARNKTIWKAADGQQGWSSGEITVSELENYSYFKLITRGNGDLYGSINSGLLLAGAVYASGTAGQVDTGGVRLAVSGTKLTYANGDSTGNRAGTTHSASYGKPVITEIIGLEPILSKIWGGVLRNPIITTAKRVFRRFAPCLL